MKIFGWKADAEILCTDCTNKRYGIGTYDNEGNEIWPIFSTDEDDSECCCNCFKKLTD